jgi:hypothetical protein
MGFINALLNLVPLLILADFLVPGRSSVSSSISCRGGNIPTHTLQFAGAVGVRWQKALIVVVGFFITNTTWTWW